MNNTTLHEPALGQVDRPPVGRPRGENPCATARHSRRRGCHESSGGADREQRVERSRPDHRNVVVHDEGEPRRIREIGQSFH